MSDLLAETLAHVPADGWRYERKFVVHARTPAEVERVVRAHPALFRRSYPPRAVNNVYFDTASLRHYRDSVEGVAQRIKVRLRWYGEFLGAGRAARLELKLKQGLPGAKVAGEVEGLEVRAGAGAISLRADLARARLPVRVAATAGELAPVVANRYLRSYWIAADPRYRLTVDSGLAFCEVRPLANGFRLVSPDARLHVVELKYAPEADAKASDVTARFPFRVGRSSKYVTGIEYVRRDLAESLAVRA